LLKKVSTSEGPPTTEDIQLASFERDRFNPSVILRRRRCVYVVEHTCLEDFSCVTIWSNG
ncbi:MAG: hypothetical protein QOK66_05735, partial [Nitrososphaeraceae archaeon]|nr:hypothetical protein [Nitrososphaeraceae archaeon]